MSETVPEDVLENDSNARERRQCVRHVLRRGVSASMRIDSGRILYVAVTDISRTGACVIRRGGLDLKRDEEVLVEFGDVEHRQKLSLQSRVEWVKSTSYNTQIGLRFLRGPLLPGTMLDEYFDQPLSLPGAGA